MNVVLDAGALIALERNDPNVSMLLVIARRAGARLITTAPAISQVWRNGSIQANLARTLKIVDIQPVDDAMARRAGELLAITHTSDVVDAYVALSAFPGDQIFTSDRADLTRLIKAREIAAIIVSV